MEAAATGPAGARAGAPAAQPDVRRLLEARQRQLRTLIAACEQLMAEMAALGAALRSGPGGDSSGPGASGAALRSGPGGDSSGPGASGAAQLQARSNREPAD